MDMFSLLPDCVLSVIVSFLPFKEAARTCILSKRWLEIWKSTTNIEFNEFFYLNPRDTRETKGIHQRDFLKFITHWISHYKVDKIDKFSLRISSPKSYNKETIESCVAFATNHGVKELKLDFADTIWDDDYIIPTPNLPIHFLRFELPKHVNENDSLESLTLYSCGFDSLKLDALKDVSLGWVGVTISTLKALLSNCNKIENLNLKKCWSHDNFDMGDDEIIGLRRLVIDNCVFSEDFYKFKAPMLRFFKFSGEVGFFHVNVSSDIMQEAEIDFSPEQEFFLYANYNYVYKLVQDLNPVKSLTLWSYLLQTVPKAPVKMENDLKVRHLTLKTEMHPSELRGFMFFLHSCPQLEKLTLEIDYQRILCTSYEPKLFEDFWQQQTLPICLEKTLKEVEVKGFRAFKNVYLGCNYLIQNGRVLEKINIYIHKDEEGHVINNNEIVENHDTAARCLLNAQMASHKLKISIV